MAENSLFKELSKPNILRLGWHLAHADSRDDFVSDPVGYEDIAANLSDRLAYLIREIRQERYRPRPILNVDLPKDGLGIRPGNVLPIEEAALLHAITYLLAPGLDRKLSSSVYSFRLASDYKKRVKKGRSLFREGDSEIPFLRGTTLRKIDPFEPWYLAWPEFDKERIDAVETKGYTHLTLTDITAYFENIDLGLLRAELIRVFPGEQMLVALLMRILESWTRVTHSGIPVGRGIPQGNEVSSFLGNIYLLPLDHALAKFCRSRKAVWLRYVDDVEVYTKRREDARSVVFTINQTLRRLHLNMQGSKTEIISGEDLTVHVARAEDAALKAAWAEIDALKPGWHTSDTRITAILDNLAPLKSRFTRGIPKSVTSLSKKDDQVLRRLMTIYGRLGRSDFERAAVAMLWEGPELRRLHKSIRYLTNLPYRRHDQIQSDFLKLLESDVPLLPYHIASILDGIRFLHPSKHTLNITGRIGKIASRSGADWLVRQKALELLSVLPIREASATRRAANALAHHHPFVRRAGLVIMLRSSVQDLRTGLMKAMHDPDPAVARLATYWHSQIDDESKGLSDLATLAHSRANDRAFLWQIRKLWLLRASRHQEVRIRTCAYLNTRSKTRSAKVQWHIDALCRQLAESPT